MITLTTSRMTLRAPEEEDKTFIKEIYQEPEMMKFMGGPLSDSKIDKLWDNWQAQWKAINFSIGVLAIMSTEEQIGVAGLFPSSIPGEEGGEIGFMILPKFQGNGYATEIARALVEMAFAHKMTKRIIADPHPDNLPSQKLFEHLQFKNLGERSYQIPEAPKFNKQILWEYRIEDWTRDEEITFHLSLEKSHTS